MDLNEQRLEYAREKMGALDADVKTFTEPTGGRLGNVVVDATGGARTMASAFHLTPAVGQRTIQLVCSGVRLVFPC